MSAGCKPVVGSSSTYRVWPRRRALELRCQLDALRLAAGQLGGRLPEPQVAEPDLAQGLEAARRRWHVGEELGCLVDGHVEHLGDGPVAVADLERLRVVARAVAGRAGGVGSWQEQQLDGDEPLALAGLAAPLRHVEREAPRRVAAPPRGVGVREHLAHGVEHAGVGREVGSRRAADRLLVHANEAIERLETARVDPVARVLDLEVEIAVGIAIRSVRRVADPSATTSASTCVTSVDFPDPDTPVTAHRTPSGNSASTSSRLWRVMWCRHSQPDGSRGSPSRGGACMPGPKR